MRCGAEFPLWDGEPTECDPDADQFYCCPKIGICMAECPDLDRINYRNKRRTNSLMKGRCYWQSPCSILWLYKNARGRFLVYTYISQWLNSNKDFSICPGVTASSVAASNPPEEMFNPDLTTKFETDTEGPHWVLVEYHVEVIHPCCLYIFSYIISFNNISGLCPFSVCCVFRFLRGSFCDRGQWCHASIWW